MGLDRAERPLRLTRDLLERQVAEEAQRDDLAVRLGQGGDGAADVGGPLRANGDARRVRRCDRGRSTASVAAAAADPPVGSSAPVGSSQVTERRWPRLAQSDPDRDPGQPRAERAVAAPARERAVGGHERLLGGVLGLVQVAEDAVAGPDDRGRFALDEEAEGIAVAGEHGIDDRAVIAWSSGAASASMVEDRLTP